MRQIFDATKFGGLTLIVEHSVVREKGGPLSYSASSSFSSPILSMLARLLLEQDYGSTIPLLLLSHHRYHPCLLDYC